MLLIFFYYKCSVGRLETVYLHLCRPFTFKMLILILSQKVIFILNNS